MANVRCVRCMGVGTTSGRFKPKQTCEVCNGAGFLPNNDKILMAEFNRQRDVKMSLIPRLYALGAPDTAISRILQISTPVVGGWRRLHNYPRNAFPFGYWKGNASSKRGVRRWEDEHPAATQEVERILHESGVPVTPKEQ